MTYQAARRQRAIYVRDDSRDVLGSSSSELQRQGIHRLDCLSHGYANGPCCAYSIRSLEPSTRRAKLSLQISMLIGHEPPCERRRCGLGVGVLERRVLFEFLRVPSLGITALSWRGHVERLDARREERLGLARCRLGVMARWEALQNPMPRGRKEERGWAF